MGVPLVAVALVGGNCNNGANYGASCVNLNNAASNANWNIGAALSYHYDIVSNWRHKVMRPVFRAAWRKLNRTKGGLVSAKAPNDRKVIRKSYIVPLENEKL